MNETQIITLLLSSAAVGALVSSVITAWITHLERKARQKELILAKAVELAIKHTEMRVAMTAKTSKPIVIYPEIVTTRFYHRQLKRLFSKDQISSDFEKEFSDYIHPTFSDTDK
jgi:hypothetical protein